MGLTEKEVIAQTQDWVEKAVIGLNLCPFAQAVHVKRQIRYVVSSAKSVEVLLADVKAELERLIATDPNKIETTLVILPYVLESFLEFNEFLCPLGRLLIEMGLEGTIQFASFHPFYRFSGTAPDAIENFTNRSPFPVVQLLRESSVEKGLKTFPDPDSIFKNNIATMRGLGHKGWKKLFKR